MFWLFLLSLSFTICLSTFISYPSLFCFMPWKVALLLWNVSSEHPCLWLPWMLPMGATVGYRGQEERAFEAFTTPTPELPQWNGWCQLFLATALVGGSSCMAMTLSLHKSFLGLGSKTFPVLLVSLLSIPFILPMIYK